MSSQIMLPDIPVDVESPDYAKYDKVKNLIDQYRFKEGSLIQILHVSQQIFGYLPMELLRYIALSLDMPISDVTGVVSFYSFFSTQPRGEHTVRVCLGTACYVRGGKKLIDRLMESLKVDIGGTTGDGKFTVEVARCIGACGLAPAIMIDDTVFKQVTVQKLDAILAKY